jgi:cytochrome c556
MRWAVLMSILASGLFILGAQAASIKSIMREMRATTREASALTQGAFDAAAARNLLEKLASEAEASAQAAGPASSARFAKFAADARNAAASAQTGAQFKSALGALASECRSCHDAMR